MEERESERVNRNAFDVPPYLQTHVNNATNIEPTLRIINKSQDLVRNHTHKHPHTHTQTTMSLFGSSPGGSPGLPPLFRDDDDGLTPGGDILRTSSQPVNVGGPNTSRGLFDDVGDGDIWALPVPRSRSVGPGTSVPGGVSLNGGGRKDVVKVLLNDGNANVPPVYGEVYEKVMTEYPAPGFGGGVSSMGVRRVIEEAGLDEDVGTGRRIREAVMGVGGMADSGVGRGEFSVLMAMVGLAQEGEDVSIDGVDDRRRSKSRTHVSLEETTNEC